MRRIFLATAAIALFGVTACERTNDRTAEIERPVIETERDTVRFPTVDAGTVVDTIEVPTIRRDTVEIRRPTIRIEP